MPQPDRLGFPYVRMIEEAGRRTDRGFCGLSAGLDGARTTGMSDSARRQPDEIDIYVISARMNGRPFHDAEAYDRF
ncbi:MAG TPA: hypothetical protein VM689_21330 [Aliidongia sp.]|nr:hypothetical protein [Aliidongia sp.]